MSKLGHGRLATLHDLDTVMPKHAVTYVITRLEKQVKYYIVLVQKSGALASKSLHTIVTICLNRQELIHSKRVSL